MPADLPPVAPPPGTEAERREVETLTRLDLSRQWRSYQATRKDRNFYQFVERDLRKRRDVGRYMTMGGIGGLFVGGAALSVFVLRTNEMSPMTAACYGLLGVSGVATIAGAVVWGVFYRRLERLEVAEDRYFALGPKGRVRMRGGGLGLQLAF